MSSPDSHPILSCAEAQALERELLRDEAAEWAAMQRAGAAVAERVGEDLREVGGWRDEPRLLVLVGKGHNGGDALLAAAHWCARYSSLRCDVLFAFGSDELRPLARRSRETLANAAGERWREIDLATLKRELATYDVCLDGVFGFQFRPPLEESTAELLAWVNTHPRLRLRAAVDLPSGLGESGNGKTVFRADFTYCTGIVKTPVVASANAAFVGRLRYLDLGFSQSRPVESNRRVLRASLLRPLAALRPALSDKRTYGHLLVVGGSRSYPGAVLMAVQAALRSGVGLLTACVPESLVPEYAAKFPEAMWVGFEENADGGLALSAVEVICEKAARASALVLGPGLGSAPETLAAAEQILRQTSIPTLLDADAIRPDLVRAAANRGLVATPHAGEWQRVASVWPAEAVLVAKGPSTRVEFGRTSYFSFFGGPVLARGGSGDLLAGLIGGLMAQAPSDLLLAAARGVVWHGLAADLLARARGQVAVQTTQLLDYLQPALHCADHDDT